LACALRFAALGAKSFWQDEGSTVLLLQQPFGAALSTIPATESTPPLYYVLAWGWTQLFGLSEVGIRSLSAVAGTAAVPIVYLAARELVSRRAAIAAAGLVAVNPLLVWFSQDARSYALLVLAVSLSFLFFVRALNRRRRAVWWWSAAAGAALATHYFAIFIVSAEAFWLLRKRVRGALPALAPIACVSGALLPLVLAQASDRRAGWIHSTSFGLRVVDVPADWLVGVQLLASSAYVAGALGAAIVVGGLWLLARRSDARERSGAALALGVAVVAVSVPLALALAGEDYFYYRNVIGALAPALVALGAGFGASRAGWIGAAGAFSLCALWTAIVVATAWQPKFNAEDWRGAARSLGSVPWQRAVVAWPHTGLDPLRVYLGASRLAAGGAAVREVDVVALPTLAAGSLGKPEVPRLRHVVDPVRAFRLVARSDGAYYTTLRFLAAQPILLRPSSLSRSGIGPEDAVVLLQRGAVQ
jgi:hypothetical protein